MPATREALGKFGHFYDYYLELETMMKEGGISSDIIDAIWRTATQSIDLEALARLARVNNSVYIDKLYAEWIAGGHDPDNLRTVFKQVITAGEPIIETPITGSWTPPTTKGLNLILDNKGSGQFYMGGIRIPEGLLLGTYRVAGGGARIQKFDGVLHDECSLPTSESAFGFLTPADNLPICTTEVYASVYKRTAAGVWEKKYAKTAMETLLFKPFQMKDGSIVAFWTAVAGGTNGGVIRSKDNGNTWEDWKTWSGKQLLALGTDGEKIRLVGNEDDHAVIYDENGNKLASRSDYPDSTYASICGTGGVWSMGANNIKATLEHRRGYIDLWDGTNLSSVRDVDPPWVMAMEIYGGVRYAIASVWTETDHTYATLVCSDTGSDWKELCQIPCPSIIGMDYADGGLYLFGGKYADYGRVYFYKL
jgi:hypothetical protein